MTKIYICNECGKNLLYENLINVKVITINKIETRFQYSCPICNGKTFKIISIINN